MSDRGLVSSPTARQCAAICALLVLIIAIPATVTLTTIDVPNTITQESTDPSPYGYTISLLLWIIPAATLALWLFPREHLKLPRRAFLMSVAILVPAGCALDFFFAYEFFVFNNRGATLGITAPALHGGVPVEEYIFYTMGFLTMLLLYIWFDEYWLNAYQSHAVPEGKLLSFHPLSFAVGVLLIVAAIVYKKLILGDAGFPGYFTFIVVFAFIPGTIMLPAVRQVVNWRAFSATMFFTLLVSILWEATLAIPYQWGGYQSDQMLGIFIGAWSDLPLEAVLVWISATYSVTLVFHTVKAWLQRKETPQLNGSA